MAAGGAPCSTSLATLVAPAAPSTGKNTFAASGASSKLDTGTEHFLLADLSAAGDKDVNIRRAARVGALGVLAARAGFAHPVERAYRSLGAGMR